GDAFAGALSRSDDGHQGSSQMIVWGVQGGASSPLVEAPRGAGSTRFASGHMGQFMGATVTFLSCWPRQVSTVSTRSEYATASSGCTVMAFCSGRLALSVLSFSSSVLRS